MMEESPEGFPIRIAGWDDQAQMLACREVAAGEVLVAEMPIAFVELKPEQEDQAPWFLLESILKSDALLAAVSALDLKMSKWPLGTLDEKIAESLARRHKKKPKKLIQLYHRVASNNIRCSTDSISGYGIWPLISRSNHSCRPNAELRGTRREPLAELLLATQEIQADEAVCWNYLSDPAFLELDWQKRNAALLEHFKFLCRCPRCLEERPAGFEAMSEREVMARLSA